MKMKVSSVAFAMLLAIFATSACAERLQIDIAALAASTNQYTSENKVATTNGWTLFAIDSYAGKPNIRLSEKGDYLISPTFSQRILSIELKVKSSSQSDRRLAFIPIYDGVPTEDATLWSLCNYSPNKDTYVAQTNFFPRAANVHSFKMAFDNGGGSTGWGISEMTIVADDTPVLTPPTNLSAGNIKGTRSNLSWVNPENAVSNKIEVSEVVRKVVYGTMLDEYDFMAFTNKSSSVTEHYDKQSLQVNDYPSFSGTNIYKAASNSTGVVQISNGKSQGYLKYDFSAIRDSLDEAADISLHISAKKHNTDISTINWKLLVAQINNNNTTNKTDEIDLTGDFPSSPFTIQVVQPNSCRAIAMRPSDETPGHRRILIDYLAFINVGPTTICETNLVITAFATNSTTYCVRELTPRTQYIASTMAFDEDGNESKQSELISFMTGSEELPFIIRLR